MLNASTAQHKRRKANASSLVDCHTDQNRLRLLSNNFADCGSNQIASDFDKGQDKNRCGNDI
jgi:hypothetical protein